jgi:hypothetical protein
MPIRINLLAEQQAAEEMRRRDPVKRALWIGGALVALVLLWILSLQLKINFAKGDLKNLDATLKRVEETSKEVIEEKKLLDETERRIEGLQKFATNRYFWATTLDVLQQIPMENIKLMELTAKQKYITNAPTKFSTLNILVPYTPPAPFWKFWVSAPPAGQLETLALTQFSALTNKPPFTTIKPGFTTKLSRSLTNADNTVTMKVESSTVQSISEELTITLVGRDYGSPPGQAVEKLRAALLSNTFFAANLNKTEGRDLELKSNPSDPIVDYDTPKPSTYILFNILLRFEERIFSQ